MATGRRRGNGEGSIYQRESDGLWIASVSLGFDANGNRKRKVLSGKTRREVAAKLREFQTAQEEGRAPTRENMTVADLIAEWLAEVVKPAARHATWETYEHVSRNHIVPMLGKVKVRDLDTRQVQGWLNAEMRSGISARTMVLARGVLSMAVKQAMRWDVVSRNVVSLTQPPAAPPKKVKEFTPEQAGALLAAFRGHRLGNFYTVCLGLGLRLGEAMGLRWQDVSLQEAKSGEVSGEVFILQQLQRVRGVGVQTAPPKSAAGIRRISLPSFVARALCDQKEVQQALLPKWEALGRRNELDLVFTTVTGTPLHARTVRAEFTRLLAEKGIPHIRIHDMRHLCASLLLSEGVPPRVIMEILGHSKISVTMDVYSHLLPGAVAGAARAMESAIEGRKADSEEMATRMATERAKKRAK